MFRTIRSFYHRHIRGFWKWKVKRLWYRIWLGVDVGLDGTMFPVFGRGQFVDVVRNGPYWEITSHDNYPDAKRGMIRLIPYQPNHGIMVEYLAPDGSVRARSHCDYQKLVQIANGQAERMS